MSLVGDVLLSAREAMTDLPLSTIPVPSGSVIPTVTPVASSAPLVAGTYFVVFTFFNQWGQTTQSAESSVVIGVGQSMQFSGTFPSWATRIRVYIGGAAGAEQFYNDMTSLPANLDSLPGGVELPPARNTAYLPDSDGQAVNASALYRWLNQALAWAAAKNRGGLPDSGAVGTTNGQPIYALNGYWKKIDTAWYDGYPLYLARKNDVFRRAPVPGTVAALVVKQASERLIMECWPQPSRTSGRAVLSAPMTAVDQTANLSTTAGFLLGFGLAQIGTEIVEFAGVAGNTLTGLTRGMNGTVPSAQAASAMVTELNLEVAGLRVPSTYAVGSAAATFNLPPGWDEALVSYILYRFRNAEQDEASAKRYLQEATAKMSDLSANRIIAGPRQIQAGGGRGAETAAGLGSPFGGVLIP